MSDLRDKAKQLIEKGKKLGDPELVQMGLDMLDLDSPTEQVTADVHECSNCGHSFPFDKPRKKCPKCGKHKLSVKQVAYEVSEPLVKEVPDNRVNVEDFTIKRKVNQDRTRYDEDGNPDGTFTRSEAIDLSNIRNEYVDDLSECAVDLDYKKITNITPRLSKPRNVKLDKTCESCNRPFKAIGKEYKCNKCIMRRR
jgi:Zn finger protein HypA/HybF involved in hydrogenase expression